MSRRALPFLLTLCTLIAATAAPSAALPLEDGTTVDRWTLENGLEVVTRDVPGSRTISIAWGYRIGQDHDPADRPGLALLLAEVALTAPAGDTPERTREEMESLRPMGWSLRVSRRQTLFGEAASRAQFPGVLHQVAERMRGVTVTDQDLRAALATVKRALAERYSGTPDQVLYWQVSEYARGAGRDGVAALAAGRGLERETRSSVARALARAYVPANGSLAIAGDLSGMDLRAIVQREFGSLPAGGRLPPAPPARFDTSAVTLPQPGVKAPVAVTGMRTPALSDTLHPSFVMALLVLGGHAKRLWDAPQTPLTTCFQYSLLEDPEFARFYPPPAPAQAPEPRISASILDWTVGEILLKPVPQEMLDGLRINLLWMMGGSMPRPLAENVRRDAPALNLLCTSLASLSLWGDESFWSGYRRRFEAVTASKFAGWADRLRDPAFQTTLMLLPGR